MPKKSATAKTTAAAAAATAVEEVVVVAPVPEVTVQETASVVEATGDSEAVPMEEVPLNQHASNLLGKINSMNNLLSQLRSEVKLYSKKTERQLKSAQKRVVKKSTAAPRKPSGFIKPARISDELAVFLGLPKGTEMARTNVTKRITQYVREHNLKSPTNGRDIIPDKKLATLLNIGKNEKLSYFNLQKYMKHHFAKAEESSSSSATATAV